MIVSFDYLTLQEKKVSLSLNFVRRESYLYDWQSGFPCIYPSYHLYCKKITFKAYPLWAMNYYSILLWSYQISNMQENYISCGFKLCSENTFMIYPCHKPIKACFTSNLRRSFCDRNYLRHHRVHWKNSSIWSVVNETHTKSNITFTRSFEI